MTTTTAATSYTGFVEIADDLPVLISALRHVSPTTSITQGDEPCVFHLTVTDSEFGAVMQEMVRLSFTENLHRALQTLKRGDTPNWEWFEGSYFTSLLAQAEAERQAEAVR